MKERIVSVCKDIEKEYNVEILFAVENGSRAWGMESADSDYDVRFVFLRKAEDYLRIKNLPDTISVAFDEDGNKCDVCGSLVDVSGFDILKFVRLLSNSNPTTIEWLISDVVYFGEQNLVFRNFAEKNFSPVALYYHYKSMSKNNYSKYIGSGKCVTYKKYLYSLRGLVNAKWVECNNGLPPIVFRDAVEGLRKILPEFLIGEIERMIKVKSSGKEKDVIKRIEKVDEYIEEFFEEDAVSWGKKKLNFKELDKEVARVILA